MRIIKSMAVLATLLFILSTTHAQTGCPGCEILLPDLAEDTLYLAPAPDGQINQSYDEDISFRLPKTTTPVHDIDPDTPAGFTINQFEITSVSNLPPGLNWEISQSIFQTADETDGCVKLCGTPLQAGLYEVQVNLTATILVIEQETSFTFSLLILPNTSTTDGFTILNNSGCGEVIASFINNVPSNGVNGFSYQWTFGNGNSSIDENPADQTYSMTGTYPVTYEAIVDTSQYYLNHVEVQNVACSDLLGGAPDLYIEISDSDGNVVFQPDPVSNASTPLDFFMYLPIGEGTYTLRVIDDDGGLDGADDICGVVNFTQLANGQLDDTDMSLSLNILHQVDTIHSIDSITVYSQPAPPIIETDTEISLCEGDTIGLHASYENNIQWYVDSIVLQADTFPELLLSEDGNYYATYTSPDACIAYSEIIAIQFNEPPAIAPYVNNNNLLELSDPGMLSEFSTLQWLLNDEIIPDATEDTYCINESGVYSLLVTNIITGCSSIYTEELEYNPNFPNCTSAIEELVFEQFKLFPNPAKDEFFMEMELEESANLLIEITNVLGGTIFSQSYEKQLGLFTLSFDSSRYSSGMYFVRIQVGGKLKVVKLVIE